MLKFACLAGSLEMERPVHRSAHYSCIAGRRGDPDAREGGRILSTTVARTFMSAAPRFVSAFACEVSTSLRTCAADRSVDATLAVSLLILLSGCARSGPPYSPQEALKKFQLPAGFRIELAASEPEPDHPRLSALGRSLRAILEGAAGNALAAGLLGLWHP